MPQMLHPLPGVAAGHLRAVETAANTWQRPLRRLQISLRFTVGDGLEAPE